MIILEGYLLAALNFCDSAGSASSVSNLYKAVARAVITTLQNEGERHVGQLLCYR